MVKRDGERCVHFVLKKAVEVPDEPETVMAIDGGEHNLAVAVAISKSNLEEQPRQALKGQFWRGEEIKKIRGLYGHIRRRLQEKKLLVVDDLSIRLIYVWCLMLVLRKR